MRFIQGASFYCRAVASDFLEKKLASLSHLYKVHLVITQCLSGADSGGDHSGVSIGGGVYFFFIYLFFSFSFSFFFLFMRRQYYHLLIFFGPGYFIQL